MAWEHRYRGWCDPGLFDADDKKWWSDYSHWNRRGSAFQASVFPLIQRGIKVLGIDMPSTPLQMRRDLWEEVRRETLLLSLTESIITEGTREDIPRMTQAMLNGQIRGRILVKLSKQGV